MKQKLYANKADGQGARGKGKGARGKRQGEKAIGKAEKGEGKRERRKEKQEMSCLLSSNLCRLLDHTTLQSLTLCVNQKVIILSRAQIEIFETKVICK